MIPLSQTASTDGPLADYVDAGIRRLQAVPPGMCPIVTIASAAHDGAAQTCGKCVPCREGLPKLAALLDALAAGAAGEATLEEAKQLAVTIEQSSDCAIGYVTARSVLDSFETFAVEYTNHVKTHVCGHDLGQSVPCETLCPAHVDVPAYIGHAAVGDFASAVNTIRKDNPYPTACALVCEHPCEQRCRRTLIDAPVNIRGIKKYVVDSLAADKVEVPAPLPQTGRRIAVIGGGPSGMTCAYYLALMGHEVTVFEARKALGGMMRYGIPAYRFPRERLDEDNRAILSAGNIEVKLESPVGTDEMVDIARRYDAAYVAIGAQAGKTLKLEGLDSTGVMSAVDMLSAIGDEEYPDFTGKNVVVVGGGNVAMDCARTAVRAGARSVTVAYRRRMEDMTALKEEVEAAVAEGVEMLTLQAPVRVESDGNDAVAALVVQPQYIGAVRRGRPAPVAADKPEQRIPADVVLIAVGQDIVSGPFEDFGMQAEWNQFKADAFLRAKGMEGVFVGGDCQTGPSTAIRAIAAGKVAARNIDEYLGFHHTLDPMVSAPVATPNDRTAYGRVQIGERPARERKNDFEYVELPMSAQEAAQECGRCLRCDCNGCGSTVGGRIQNV